MGLDVYIMLGYGFSVEKKQLPWYTEDHDDLEYEVHAYWKSINGFDSSGTRNLAEWEALDKEFYALVGPTPVEVARINHSDAGMFFVHCPSTLHRTNKVMLPISMAELGVDPAALSRFNGFCAEHFPDKVAGWYLAQYWSV